MDNPIELLSPFPETDYPAMYHWFASLKGGRDYYDHGTTLNEFVELQRRRSPHVQTWGAYRNDELGGYIEFAPCDARVGFAKLIFKKSFWGNKSCVPAIDNAMEQIWSQGFEAVLFDPLFRNSQIRYMLRQVGAREAGPGTNRDVEMMILTSGRWSEFAEQRMAS